MCSRAFELRSLVGFNHDHEACVTPLDRSCLPAESNPIHEGMNLDLGRMREHRGDF